MNKILQSLNVTKSTIENAISYCSILFKIANSFSRAHYICLLGHRRMDLLNKKSLTDTERIELEKLTLFFSDEEYKNKELKRLCDEGVIKQFGEKK